MIDVEKVIQDIPTFGTFCSMEKMYSLVEELRSDDRFKVDVVGESETGMPIHHIKFGRGSIKALIVAGPHADEPIGGLTVYSLLILLKDNHKELVHQDVEWHIVPCIDPDGAKYNEGWTQKKFTLENFMKYFYKQNMEDQVDCSFPIKYKKIDFDKPTCEAKALMKILDHVLPDFYFSLHNTLIGGAHYYLTRDIGQKYYQQFYSLLQACKIPLHVGPPSYDCLKMYDKAIFEQCTFKKIYDGMEIHMEDPSAQLKGGMTSVEYLEDIKESAFTILSELSYVNHPLMRDQTETGINFRQLMLRTEADLKFLKTVIFEEWEKVKDDLNKNSPFYRKISSHVYNSKEKLHEFLPDMFHMTTPHILFHPDYSRLAREDERFNVYMRIKYRFLCNNSEFIRLLRDSHQTPAVIEAIKTMDALFAEAFEDISNNIDFEAFEVIDVNVLAKAQLGSGLIALNSVLEH